MPEQNGTAAAAAAVTFDSTARKFTVVSERKVLEGVEKGAMMDWSGKQLTVLELCDSVDEAKALCESRTVEMNNAKVVSNGVDRIVFDSNGEAISDEAYSCDATPENTMDGVVTEARYRQESMEPPYNFESVDVVRDVLENLMEDFSEDVIRINRRYQEIKQILVRYYGTAADGSIINTFETEHPRSLKLGSKFVMRRSLLQRRDRTSVPTATSYFDRLVELENRDYINHRDHYRDPRDTRRSNKRNGTKRAADDDDSDDYEPPQAKRNTNQIGRAGAYMRYPFVERDVEEEIFYNCGNNASAYAQQLGKILFADTLNLYFKDQDPKRRDWIHEAVDFRFPSEDKNAQLSKWKNCSNSINKNMREKEKERQREVERAKPKELDYKYLSRDFEMSCLERANGDPVKYAEVMALKLFEKTVDKYFKEQDPVKKDWLRTCIDRRFHCGDKEKRDQRWKVCAAACNKNRTKIIGPDGLENPFPYFAKEIEEDCYKKCGKVPAVYAEAMCKHLFPDTQNLLFKDQDIGKRNWLHDILDRRFPTSDKIEQIAKWKSCTSAINKNKADDSILSNDSSMSLGEEAVVETPKNAPKVEKKEERKENDRLSLPLRDRKKEEDSEAGSVQNMPTSKRLSRRSAAVAAVVAKEEEVAAATPTSSPLTAKGSANRTAPARGSRKEKVVVYDSYPFLSEEEELDCLEKANGNPQVYARAVGKILFKDTIKLYYKDQEPDRRQWMREIIDFRFPTDNAADQKQKWKNVTAAINKNMTLR